MTFVLTFEIFIAVRHRDGSFRLLTYWAITNLSSGMQRRPKREETLVGIVGSISLNFHGVLIVCRLFHPPNVTTDLSPFLSLALSDNS